MTVSGIIRLLSGFTLLAILAVVIAACEGDSSESTAIPLRTPQFVPTPIVVSVTTPVPTATNTPTPAPSHTPSTPTPAEILRQTTTAMQAIQSGHIEMDITNALEGENGFIAEIHVSGDFQLPDRSQATMLVKAQGFTVELEFIAIGVKSYLKNPLTGEWEANVDGGESFGNILASPAFETDFPVEKAAQFELVGIESLDGKDVYHLRAQVTGSELVNLMDDQSVSTAEGEVAYWIGVDDFLVGKVEVSAQQQSEGFVNTGVDTVTTHFVITLSNYNGDVNIVAPEVGAS